jgi:hypothetical protein
MKPMKTRQNLSANQRLIKAGFFTSALRLIASLVFILAFLFTGTVSAQLGIYEFTGKKNCPTQNPAVTSQPTNALFSNFSTVNASCKDEDDICNHERWNKTATIDLGQYHQFNITADPKYTLNLTSLSFTNFVKDEGSGNTQWILRSSLDNYASEIATGTALQAIQKPSIVLPATSFSSVSNVTFRLYLINSKDDSNEWTIDDVALDGSVIAAPATPDAPASDSPQCSNPGVTIKAGGTPPSGETWYWQTSANGTSTTNSSSTWIVNSSGTYYIRSQDNTTLVWSNAASITVTVTPDVSVPVFTLGANSTRCFGAGTVTYTATSANNTGITYSLDAASLAGGNTINSSTGAVTYVAGWTGTSIITASAAGCNGPQTAMHTVTINPAVGVPVFTLGASSTRCSGASTITYTATATSSTGITYSLDALSLLGGNSINAATGTVTFAALWVGTSTITASATGCGGPRTAAHTVTVGPNVTTPVFASGASSTRCQGAGLVTYSATATNTTGITYTLDAASLAGGNSVNASTGEVTFVAGWSGTSTVTASAAGCAGPRTANHTITTTPTVGTPVFTIGATSTRCQGNGNINYNATATNNTGISYSLDAASLAGGNTINSTNGVVNYSATWSGTTIITATANGCNGPSSSTHTVTITPTVGIPVFTMGASSTRCQGAGNIIYDATATNVTGITYSLNAASIAGGNTINAATGEVTYAAGFSGTSIVTASAAGCGGPRTATHTVTVTATVGLPTFTLGVSSSRCQGAGTVIYSATATNSTAISYSLDAASLAGGNTINTITGEVAYNAGWSGTSVITASAEGCNGPVTNSHSVTINPPVGTPVFSLGASSSRCERASSVTYTASAVGATSITYSLDAASTAGGNTINSANGTVTFVAGWNGTSTITAVVTGCNGPQSSNHIVTTTPSVTTPIFALGATSSRCQGSATVSYAAISNNSTGITYSLNGGALAGGNTIDANTGEVTYVASWTGITIITASAGGCNGPRSATHTVTTTGSVATPVFTIGATSSRCQGAGTVTYTVLAANNTGITYSLDAISLAGGNTINSITGAVTYAAGWSGASTITAIASGCNGPTSSSHTATTNPSVSTPVFAMGSASTRCQGIETISYTATATGNTGITYSLNGGSLAGGNTINSLTGEVTYAAGYVGTSIITASAAGCGGPRSATHTVTVTPTVGIPAFTLGTNSTRCQGAGTVTYTAVASNSTGITYSLDATTIAGGNTINPTTGVVTYVLGWNGTSIITAAADGCNGPRTATHTVVTTPGVGTPIFTMGTTSTRCQGTSAVTYTATASNSTGITYSLDAASIAGGNSISSSTGIVSYTTTWSGTSIITASAAGCNGPVTSTHTVTVTPTVGVPVFTSGPTSTRCQGAGTVTYAATATNSTSIIYSLDATSLAGGNSINASTGAVTYVAGWTGTSTITASAAGCNGPRTSTHTVTITPTVGTPVFTLGSVSTRLQGAGTITYTANATNATGITYSLDAASLAGGNTINTATGAVTYTAAWINPTIITASAAGCNGPRTATHTVTVNSASVTKQLYLSDPSQSLDRVDPVNTSDGTTATTGVLGTSGPGTTTTTTFTMGTALCSDLIIKAGTISVANYINVASGTMPANPNITAELRYGSTTIITLTNPIYSAGLLTWTGTLASDVVVPAGQTISLVVTTAQGGVTFRIEYDSQTRPSRINLPVATFINVTSLGVYTAAYPGGSLVTSGVGGTTKYIRAVVTDPFGFADITGMNITITPTGSTVSATSVGTTSCTRTYEYIWSTPASSGNYAIAAIAREGYENSVTHTRNTNYSICATCAPVARNDSASGAGGTPTVIDVLANDYDPNNNMNNASLAIIGGPNNGSAYISNNMIVYLPNGAFSGQDTITYQICDNTSPTPLCATAQIFLTIDPLIIDICGDASKTHTYYVPYPEQQSHTALAASGSPAIPSNNIRTVISIKVPYPGMRIVWDEWEDGYEANSSNPVQSSTKVWGDGNPFNGIAPGFPTDIIPAGGSIVLDNTMPANPRNSSNIYYDGRDKVVSSGQIAMTQVSAEPSIISVQSIKTNITSTYDFGQSFTIPLGEDFPSRDFRYTALFIRASQNNTTVNIDKDNNGAFETTVTLNEGESYLVNGGVRTGATVASDKPVGVELNAGGVDNYSIRNAPIFPATWYSNTYYTPVPTSDNAGDNPKDSSVVMFYNSLNRSININWYSGIPSSGVITVPAKSAVRFPLAYSTTAAYRFVNLTGESFTAIEIVNSYSPGGGGTSGTAYDWSFNLISEARLTDYTTVAWAPGGLDLVAPTGPDVNGNPVWVTPTANTTVYVKYDGNISGTSGLVSPCGLRYDISYNVNALNYIKIRDPNDNDQGGIAVYTCNGAKIAAVYGEDPQGSTAGNSAYWDVGTTIQPFCKEKIVIATDDYASTLVSQPVTISVLLNDFGFLSTIDPSTVSTLGLMQPRHGTVNVHSDGAILYTPNIGYSGVDTFEYRVCSTPSPVVCDVALVIVNISTCPSNGNQNIISGQIFRDINKDALNNDGGLGLAGIKVYLYTDGNCSGTINSNELTDSVTVDSSGFYQFAKYPEKTAEDNFDDGSGGRTCNNGSDGDTPWAGNWVDANDPSAGFCNNSQSAANTDVDIFRDGAFSYALRFKDANRSATRAVDLNGATKAFLTFSYRRKSATLTAGEDVLVQASSNGSAFTTIYTIPGNGTADAGYVTIYNQDITSYASSTSAIRFLTNGSVDDADTVYIDNVSIRYLRYPQCYITSIAMSSVPANYALTTPGQRITTINSGGSCVSQFDFGFGKPNVTVSGTLYNDRNGLTDGLVNGTAIGSPGGAAVYAYLTDATGLIVFKATVNAVNGAYSFPLAEIQTNYNLSLSTTNVSVGATPPSSFAGSSSTWVSVGDSYGTNNGAGSGIEAGTPNSTIAISTGMSNVTNVNFGIERLPNTDNHTRSINQPNVNQLITLNGVGMNPPILSGSDPEDCTVGCTVIGRSVIIDTVPARSELYYNNVLVISGQTISNFDPNSLQVKFTPAALGDVSVLFRYSFIDDAGIKDPSPASYTLVWLIPLPAEGLVASASLNDDLAKVKWSTISEHNTAYFEVERSLDNVTFTATGQQVQASGESETPKQYQMNDKLPGQLRSDVVYYRIKLVDQDGKFTYSNIVVVRISKKPGVTVWPNPFQSYVTVSITTERDAMVDVNLIDVSGKVLKKISQSVSRGISQIVIKDLDQLPGGVYLMEIADKSAGTTYQKLLKNNK